MFIGHITQRQFCAALSPQLQRLIDEVLERIATPLATGKHELQGESAFFLVMEDHTQPLALRRSECHARYLDVQILLQGRERFVTVSRRSMAWTKICWQHVMWRSVHNWSKSALSIWRREISLCSIPVNRIAL
ncbi:hypothetical protein VCSRO133_1890 [Vibrio cholerae]|nr:hypothetical protein VCSRO133_1890 [Vibrio cholerae]